MDPSSPPFPGTLSPAERLRRSEAAGRALVAGWEASGMTMRAYSQQVGVRAQRLSYWRLRLGRAASPLPADAAGFVEITAGRRPVASGLVVELADGLCVRVEVGFDPVLLRAVVSALSGARC